LPLPSDDADKEERGHVLVLGGSREMPGAVILAATAALRAGAGKLTIATGRSVAQLVALAIPESMVLGLAKPITAASRWKREQARPAGQENQCDPDRTRHAGRKRHRAPGACMLPRLHGGEVKVCWMRTRWAPCCIRLGRHRRIFPLQHASHADPARGRNGAPDRHRQG
jgi:hypothetical protein